MGRRGKLAGHHDVRGQGDLRAPRARLVDEGTRHVEHVRLVQRFPDGHAGGGKEGIGDAAPHDQLVAFLDERLQHREFRRDLGTGDDRHHRTGRPAERALECVEFADQQGTRAGHRRETRDAMGAGLGAMRRAEGVHDINVAQRRHAARQGLVVLLLAAVEAHVLAQHDFTGRALHAVQPVELQGDVASQQL